MNTIVKILIGVAILLLIITVINTKIKKPRHKKIGNIKSKIPLSKNEQPMFFRLTEAFPEKIVLAQVAFSALLQSKETATRNQFDRKVADFVLCTNSFEVLAIIELDDSSHKGRETQDAARDLLLTNAGYKVLRYKQVPDVDKVRKDITTLATLQS